MKSILVPILVLYSLSASAFIKQGTFSGGTAKPEADAPLSLLKFEKNLMKSGSERISLTLGDKNGSNLSEPSFFHVALDESGRRLVLDLAQVQQTSVDQSDLKSVLKTSPLIKSAEITMDPVDKSTNITFTLKKAVVAQAATNKNSGQVIIDLQEAK